MDPQFKGCLAAAFASFVLVVLAALAGFYWLSKSGTEGADARDKADKQAYEDGRHAAKVDGKDCLNAAARRMRDCKFTAIRCKVEATRFHEGCLDGTGTDPAILCKDVPREPLERALYGKRICDAKMPDDPMECVDLVSMLLDYCGKQQ